MLEYHLGWRGVELERLAKPAPAGKKLRPALVLLVSQAVSGEITAAAQHAAAAVELVHNFSLVHDDIQDRSELRRHRPTLWSLWGMPQAINAGDALFALAQVVVVQDDSTLAAQLANELNRAALRLSEGTSAMTPARHGPVTPCGKALALIPFVPEIRTQRGQSKQRRASAYPKPIPPRCRLTGEVSPDWTINNPMRRKTHKRPRPVFGRRRIMSQMRRTISRCGRRARAVRTSPTPRSSRASS